MSHQAHEADRQFLRDTMATISRSVMRRCCCRQCGERSALWDSICQSCGAADPVRLPVKWLVYGTTFLAMSGVALVSLL
jgi:hypothetical protein